MADTEGFIEVVKNAWESNTHEDVFINFKVKMKMKKLALTKWSREKLGYIFQQLAIREEIVKIKEALFEEFPTAANRVVLRQAQAELVRYLKMEEDYWMQKTGIQWFSEGDRNTRFFHSMVRGRRNRSNVNRIQKETGD